MKSSTNYVSKEDINKSVIEEIETRLPKKEAEEKAKIRGITYNSIWDQRKSSYKSKGHTN